jgi:phospholipid transport system substrate-binding protein
MRFTFSVVLLAALASPIAVHAQASDPARLPIQSLNEGLISIMKGGKQAGFRARASAIQPIVDRVFDLPLMTRLAVGTGWTKMTPADQAGLVAALRRMTVAQYADNFDSYGGQSFVVDPRIEARGTDRLVRTTLNTPRSESVAISYRLRQSGGSWKVIDVYYKNAISQLATRRSDFERVLASGGAKALIAHLNALAAKAET